MTLPGFGSLSLDGLARPWMLAFGLVPVVLLGFYALAQRRRRRRLEQFGTSTALPRLTPAPRRWRHLPIALASIALLLLSFALAGPTHETKVPNNRAVVMLVIDVSQSMNADDEPPTRLRAAEAAATRFAQELTPGINLGLISFAGNVNLLVSPSPDHQATVDALSKLKTDDATATGEALFTALESIQTIKAVLTGLDSTPPPARIVLLSDGLENRPTNPDNPRGAYTAARLAAEQNVPISTIAVGTKSGYVKVKDQRVPVPADDAQMKRVAELSGGHSYRAADVDALNASYADVLEQVGYQTVTAPEGTAWLRLAVLTASLATVAALVVNRTLPT